MRKISLAYAKYWRKSLVDAEFRRGGFEAIDVTAVTGFTEIPKKCLQTGQIALPAIQELFAEESDQQQTVPILLRPLVLCASTEHRKKQPVYTPEIITPLITFALLRRDGQMHPLKTVLARDLLEPVLQPSFTIGTLQYMGAFLAQCATTAMPSHEQEPSFEHEEDRSLWWENYQQTCKRFIQLLSTDAPFPFAEANYAYVQKQSALYGKSKHIQALYAHLRIHKPESPLFDCYAGKGTANQPREPLLPVHSMFTQRLGHTSNTRSLPPSQRHALSQALNAQNGEILAINTPVGVGKTAFIHATIATLWTQAALKKNSAPPIIVATCAHDKAIHRLLESLREKKTRAHDDFSGRWLPGIKSYGSYFPSQKSAPEHDRHHQTQAFFKKIESSDYLTKARKQYLTFAKAALPEMKEDRVEAAIEALHQRILAEAAKLLTLETAWQQLTDVSARIKEELGEKPTQALLTLQQDLEKANAQKALSSSFLSQWKAFKKNNLGLLSLLFAWVPSVAKKRLSASQAFLKTICPEEVYNPDWQSIKQIDRDIHKEVYQKIQAVQELDLQLSSAQQLPKTQQVYAINWTEAISVFKSSDLPDQATLSDIDALADKTIRFTVLRLATHYWEGRWLLEMQNLLDKPEPLSNSLQNTNTDKNRWQLRMMITPCIITSLDQLPKLFKSEHDNNNSFADSYFYNFADLLIIDEAGQISPEVAGSSFALAQKAIVLGDTSANKPIWAIDRANDIVNLQSSRVISGSDVAAQFQHLAQTGKTASCGSVMHIAQNVFRHENPNAPTASAAPLHGLFLSEHWRSFDNIINFRNTLCYHNLVRPMRGDKAYAVTAKDGSLDGLPATGYLHIDGACIQTPGGSYHNLLEAQTVAAWLVSQKERLEQIYSQPLANIVAIVTPFEAQVRTIVNACNAQNITAGNHPPNLPVGTTYTLQDTARPVVIFSNVYSKHVDHSLANKDPALLNAAESLAKNTFLFFGDMDILEHNAPDTPQGELARLLLSNNSTTNALTFEPLPRQDLEVSHNVLLQLQDPVVHNAFFQKILNSSAREIFITSPSVSLKQLHQTGILESMSSAVQRGTKICIYTDLESNTIDENVFANAHKKKYELRESIEALQSQGVEVHIIAKIHSNLLIRDDDTYCVGYYNWLNPFRSMQSHQARTSLAYGGKKLQPEIEAQKSNLQQRIIEFT